MFARTPGILLLLLLFTARATAQDESQLNTTSHPTLAKINAMVEARKYKSAIDLSLATADRMKAQSHWKEYISFMLRAAEIETFEVWKGKGFAGVDLYPDYRRPLKYLQTLNMQAGKLLDHYPQLKANVLFTNAVVYHWLDMADTAQTLHIRAMDMRKKIYGESSREVADSYLWLGVLYNWGLHRRDLGEHYYRLALDLQKKFLPHSRYALGSVYYGLANIARENFQFDEALVLANQYLSLYHDIPYEQAFGIQLIANVYWTQGNYEKSFEYRRQTVKIYEESNFQEDLIMEYSNLANDLTNLGRYPEAELELKKGEQILNKMDLKDPYYSKMLFESFGDLYHSMKKYDVADLYFQRALSIATNHYGARNDEVADIYRMRGEMFKDQMLFEKSLQDYQNMLMAVIPGFHATDYTILPDVQFENPYYKNIISAIFHKGDAWLAWYRHSGEPKYLDLALQNYRLAFHQIMVARNSVGDDLSKPFLMYNFRESIENSVQCARILFLRTGDEKFIQDVFNFVEFTKYLNVLDALQRAERANNSEVPVELFFQLEATRSELSKLQRIELQQAHLGLSNDSVATLRDNILDLIQRRKKLLSEIARNAGHVEFSPEKMIMSMADVQGQLKDDEQILEFYWGSDTVYTVSLTARSASVSATAHSADVDSVLLSVHGMLEGQLVFQPGDVRNYSLLTSTLYRRIFEPLVKNKKVTIIPDGPLNLIPVEALVKKHDPAKLTFPELDYLIHDHDISYAYSSSIQYHKKKRSRTKIEKVLAFSYTGGRSDVTTNQKQLVTLPGTLKEIEALSEIFNNISPFTEGNALKGNFIKHAGDYDLIHLGVHGIGDPELADNSRLVFMGDSLDNSDLYAYEIYNLNMDASLVVLSACETGRGKHQTGEGIFSIARAFSYAGCPSVVMSMWKVNDRHTAALVSEFYYSLNKGRSLSASLREAKLKFLSASDEFSSHPANWSAFVLNGQDQSFEENATRTGVWLTMISLGLGLLFLAVRQKWFSVTKPFP